MLQASSPPNAASSSPRLRPCASRCARPRLLVRPSTAHRAGLCRFGDSYSRSLLSAHVVRRAPMSRAALSDIGCSQGTNCSLCLGEGVQAWRSVVLMLCSSCLHCLPQYGTGSLCYSLFEPTAVPARTYACQCCLHDASGPNLHSQHLQQQVCALGKFVVWTCDLPGLYMLSDHLLACRCKHALLSRFGDRLGDRCAA